MNPLRRLASPLILAFAALTLPAAPAERHPAQNERAAGGECRAQYPAPHGLAGTADLHGAGWLHGLKLAAVAVVAQLLQLPGWQIER